MPRPTPPVAVLFGLAGLCAAIAGGVSIAGRATPDAILAHGFGQALAQADVSWSTPPPNIWLSSLDGAGAARGLALSVGASITIAGKGGRPERIEVTGLEQVDGDRLGLPGFQFQLVTGLIDGATGGDTASQHVRFLFTVDVPPVTAPATVDRVL